MKIHTRKLSLAALGTMLAVPVGLVLGPRSDPALMVHIPYGAFGCCVLALGYILWRIRTTNRLSVPASGKLPRLVFGFFVLSFVSVLIGLARYLQFSGVISFTYQFVLVSYCLVGYWLLRDKNDVLLFFRTVVLSSSVFAFGLVIYVVQSGRLSDVHGLHNDLELRNQVLGWPNAYGCFLCIAMIFAMLLASLAATSKFKLFYGSCAAVLLAGIIVTFSRSAYVMVLVSVLLRTFFLPGILRKVVVVVLVASLALTVVVVFPDLPGLLFYVGTAEVRWSFTEMLLSDTTLLDPISVVAGHGYQSLHVIAGNRAGEEVLPGLSFEEMSTHDEYMTMFLKAGLLGLGLFLMVLLFALRDSFWLSRKHPDPVTRSIFLHWACILPPLFMSMLANETLRYWPVAVVFWMLTGALLNFRRNFAPYAAVPSASARRAPLPVMAGGFSSASSVPKQ